MTEPLRRSRGTVFAQVVVAAVFLAVIGGSVGLALGLRERDQGNHAASGEGGTTQPGGSGESPPVSPSASPVPCPEEIEQQAGQGDLVRLLYIQTKYSEVWICADGGGKLFYQGHRGGPDERPIQPNGDDWLFLSDVQQSGDEYLATNYSGEAKTVYRVSPEQLVIDHGGDKQEVQPVISLGG